MTAPDFDEATVNDIADQLADVLGDLVDEHIHKYVTDTDDYDEYMRVTALLERAVLRQALGKVT